mmetsp:Transcript_24322/g.59966  ORF Transcript_24322/g.59966 Transcript_24322/m.59966 type:complete len:164 (+) Transcript_24322:166-657(+)
MMELQAWSASMHKKLGCMRKSNADGARRKSIDMDALMAWSEGSCVVDSSARSWDGVRRKSIDIEALMAWEDAEASVAAPVLPVPVEPESAQEPAHGVERAEARRTGKRSLGSRRCSAPRATGSSRSLRRQGRATSRLPRRAFRASDRARRAQCPGCSCRGARG